MAKLFQILVPDNTLVSRIISCESQVTELFVIDRADKKFVSDYASDLNKPALYILVNRDKRQLYVGETDDSIKRLKNHEAKDFWTEAIVFHSTGDTLSTTEVKWLEAKTYEALKDLGYYDLSENKQVPQQPPLKKNQIYTLEPIFDEAKNYICAAGFDIFLKKKEDNVLPTESVQESKQMVWLLPSNLKYFDLKTCFKKEGKVYWQIKNNFKKVKDGDRGYIYSSHPDKAILYSFEVVKAYMPYNPEMDTDDKYAKNYKNKDWGLKGGCFALLKMAEVKNNKNLTLLHLRNNGLNGAPQSAFILSQKKYEKLLSYIDNPPIEPVIVKTTKKNAIKPPFKFSMVDLKQGDVITFIPTGVNVVVAGDDKTIVFNGESYTLTGFCKKFIPEDKRNPAEAYQGPKYFSYNGKSLKKLRLEKEKNK